MVTTCSPLPKDLEQALIKKYRCDLLHEKTPIYDAKNNRIYHYCKICEEEKKGCK